MAAIVQEWQAILTTCKKITEKTGAALPDGLQRMEGDVWARQAGRLRALSGWLRDVDAAIPALRAEDDKPPADKPETAAEIDPDSGLPLTQVPSRKKKGSK